MGATSTQPAQGSFAVYLHRSAGRTRGADVWGGSRAATWAGGVAKLHTRAGPTTTASYPHSCHRGQARVSAVRRDAPKRLGPQLAELAAMRTWARN